MKADVKPKPTTSSAAAIAAGDVLLSLEPRALLKAVDTEAGANTLITLRVEGNAELSQKVVMLRDLQVDPVRRAPLHADLYEVRMDETITVRIPVRVVGRAAGVEEGGILDHSLRDLEIECLPGNIPPEVEVDVSALAIGDSIHVSDLQVPEGVKVLEDPGTTVAAVTTPNVPSAPMKSCFQSYPVLFFRSPARSDSTWPEGSTTSSPSTRSRMFP